MKLERHESNPILRVRGGEEFDSGAVFNCGAALATDGKTYLLYRAVSKGYTRSRTGRGYDNYVSSIGLAGSEDGIHFERLRGPVIGPSEEYDRFGCEDPRITGIKLHDGNLLYLITYTALSAPAFSGHGNRVALASTKDFNSFVKHGVIIPGIESKDAVIFPELIQGKITLLHRVLPEIQIVHIDHWNGLISPAREFWREYNDSIDNFTIMKPEFPWEAEKIGPGPPPLKTEAGWLQLYHGVDSSHVYRVGAALLDKNDPSKVVARLPDPLLEPEADYERFGDVNNVVFPCGLTVRDGVVHVYYGAADKCCCLATAGLDELLDHLLSCGKG